MLATPKEEMIYLSSMFSKMVKLKFGKGPETCYVILKGRRLFIYIGNFMTPAEEALLESKEVNLATRFRCAVINSICTEFVHEVTKVLHLSFDSFFYDWNYSTNKGIIILENTRSNSELKIDVPYEKRLFELIGTVCSKYQKIPDHFQIVKNNPKICAVECKGVLLQLEKSIHQKGDRDLLLERSREVKREYIKHKSLFEQIFHQTIEEFFIIWDYENDRSYIVFSFN